MFADIMGDSEALCVYRQREFFRCLVDYDDNFSENPTEAAVVFLF